MLNKEEFVDVMCIRYLHPLKNMPKKCACGNNNSLYHALICMKGGYVAMGHNQIRDLIINLLIESGCKDIVREPHLLPLRGESFTLRSVNTSQEARLDIAVQGVHNSMEKTFCDVRVFHSSALSNQCQTVEASFKKHQDEKKRTYNARVIEVEQGFSTSGSREIFQWVVECRTIYRISVVII